MKGYYIRSFAILISVIVSLFFCFACNEKKLEQQENETHGQFSKISDSYNILVTEFDSLDTAERFLLKLNPDERNNSKIIESSSGKGEKLFYVRVGRFQSSFEAGNYAFGLILDSLITGYLIMYNDSLVMDDFRDFGFVAGYLNRPSLYKFDLVEKKYNLVWSKWGKKIISLDTNPQMNKGFYLTAFIVGKRGGFPYITDTRVYYFDVVKDEIKNVDNIGKGIQINSYWETADHFKVIFTILDSLKTSALIQKIITYNIGGKIINTEEMIYELLIDGIPPAVRPVINLVSPDGRFRFIESGDEEERNFYIYDDSSESSSFILSTKEELIDLKWTRIGKYLIINTELKGKDLSTSSIFIVNLISQKMVRSFEGNGLQNLQLHGSLLLFDEKINKKSSIKIYDYLRDRIYFTISVPGGCGLKNILLRK